MFQRLPAYESVKRDEFWGTSVPAHWSVLPGLAVCAPNKRRNTHLAEVQVLSLSYGNVVVKPVEKQHGLVPESYEGYQVLDPGDIVVRPTDLQNDQTSIRIGLVRDRGIITSAYIGLRTKAPWTTDYAYAYLFAVDATKRIYGMGGGLRQQLDWGDIKRMPSLVPPAKEQVAIAKYLAHANARIDSVIATKTRLIALLVEAQRATATSLLAGHGLTDRVESSAPWLASVPRNWNWRRLRTLTSLVTSGSRGWADYYADSGALFLQSGNLGRDLRLRLENVQRVDLPGALEGLRTRVRGGDALVCITGALTGNVALVPSDWSEEAYVNQHVALVRPRESEVFPPFLANAMASATTQAQFKGSEYGGTKQGLGLDEVKNAEVLLPPLDEQIALVARIERETTKADRTIDRAHREVQILREFRMRLVADVVTGQVDVREIAASLPSIELATAFSDQEIVDGTNAEESADVLDADGG